MLADCCLTQCIPQLYFEAVHARHHPEGGGGVGTIGQTHPTCLTYVVHMQTGSNISRRSRAKDLPSRPKAGWSMVVQDVSEEGSKKQFVALPGGRSRRLTADEEVYLERMKPKRRKRIV